MAEPITDNTNAYKKYIYRPPTPPNELIDPTVHVIDFTARKFLHVGLDHVDNFDVVIQIITPSRHVCISPSIMRRIFSLMGNILSFILNPPQNTSKTVFLETEFITLTSMVYRGENILVIESNTEEGCRVLLKRSDLINLQYMEWCIFETITRKTKIVRPIVLEQLEDMVKYLKKEYSQSKPSNIEELTNFVQNIREEDIVNNIPTKFGFHINCIICKVRKTFKLSQKNTGSSFKASTITNRLSLICKQLSIRRQEDAHEFLRYLIESMERCYLSVLGHAANSLDNYSKKTTPINQIFGGYVRTEVTCGQCGQITTTFQHLQDLILDITQSDNVTDALDNYFENEILDEYVCESCRRPVAAHKKFSIERSPYVLCIQLKRYSVDMRDISGNKINKAVKIDETLNVSNYLFNEHKDKTVARPLVYRLTSIVQHNGKTLNSGHYTAICRTSSGSYYHFNDSTVYPTKFHNFSNSNDSYILFYELESYDECDSNIQQLKQGHIKEKSQTKVPRNSSSIKKEPTTNGIEPLSRYNGLVPHIDSDKEGSNAVSKIIIQIISRDNNGIPAIAKIKYLLEQKVPDKRSPLETWKLGHLETKKPPIKKSRVIRDPESLPDCKKNGKVSNGNRSFEVDVRSTFNNEFKNNFNGKSNGNSIKESKKSRTHLGFDGNVKTRNGDNIFVGQESEQEKSNGVKRNIDDDNDNDDFDRKAVKKKKFNKNSRAKENGPKWSLQEFYDWMNRTKNDKPNNNGYRNYVKTQNGDKSFVGRESEQKKSNGVKRNIDDDNDDFDRRAVKKKKFNMSSRAKKKWAKMVSTRIQRLDE